MKLYCVMIPDSEIGILVYEDGTSSNRFADGVAGVPKDWQKEAELAFDPSCDMCVGEE